jgi:hypothetical protein
MIGLALAVALSTAPPPGAIDPNCTKELICQDGYTKTVRPSVPYTNGLKKLQLEQRNLTDSLTSYEEDHFVPLELCGCAKCTENLWPEPWEEARKKDRIETWLHKQVCAGKMTLQEAQQSIYHWQDVYDALNPAH